MNINLQVGKVVVDYTHVELPKKSLASYYSI
jgi:hypothetical protein